jgi:hypothetical protein
MDAHKQNRSAHTHHDQPLKNLTMRGKSTSIRLVIPMIEIVLVWVISEWIVVLELITKCVAKQLFSIIARPYRNCIVSGTQISPKSCPANPRDSCEKHMVIHVTSMH